MAIDNLKMTISFLSYKKYTLATHGLKKLKFKTMSISKQILPKGHHNYVLFKQKQKRITGLLEKIFLHNL